MKIGLTYDLRSEYTAYINDPDDYYVEFDSEETIVCLEQAMSSLGHQALRIGNVHKLIHFLVAREQSVDLVFNIAEGRWGRSREAQVPAILEAFQIPYTFSDPLTTSVCLDKAMAKRLLQTERLATPQFWIASSRSELESKLEHLLGFPLFIKPLHEGTSKGISSKSIVLTPAELIAHAAALLEKYRQPVLIEEYLPGREFTVGILGSDNEAKVLGIVEIALVDKNEQVYGFIQKEESEHRVLYKPIELAPLAERMSELALSAYITVGCRDAGRVDIRLDKEGNPQVLEINPLPGMHPTHSDLPIIAKQAGVTYEQLIARILEFAAERSKVS
jgi:D-alanine-D-alanine ligase